MSLFFNIADEDVCQMGNTSPQVQVLWLLLSKQIFGSETFRQVIKLNKENINISISINQTRK